MLSKVRSVLRVLEIVVYTPHLLQEVGNRRHELVQLQRHCHRSHLQR